jgi:hypothetical protein
MEDYLFWLEASFNHIKFRHIKLTDDIYYYRIHEKTLTNDIFQNNSQKVLLKRLYMFLNFKYFKLNEDEYLKIIDFILCEIKINNSLEFRKIYLSTVNILKRQTTLNSLIYIENNYYNFQVFSLLNNSENYTFLNLFKLFYFIIFKKTPKIYFIRFMNLYFYKKKS